MASCFSASPVMCWKMLVGRLEKTGLGMSAISRSPRLWPRPAARLKTFQMVAAPFGHLQRSHDLASGLDVGILPGNVGPADPHSARPLAAAIARHVKGAVQD